MSAYVMEAKEIAAIGRFVDKHSDGRKLFVYRKGREYGENYLTGQRVAEVLMRENVRSVNFRYDERYRARKFDIKREFSGTPDSRTAYRLLSCWRYQACERPDFKRSEAFDVYVALLDLIADIATSGEL